MIGRRRLRPETLQRQALADVLTARGALPGIEVEQLRRIADLILEGTPVSMALSPVGWRADGEDLADGEVEALLQQMRPALSPLGINLEVESLRRPHTPDSGGYSILVNGQVIDLYDLDPNEPNLPLDDDPWTTCTVRPLARVNDLLEAGGMTHRVAVFSCGGSDGFALLASETLINQLETTDLLTSDERPVVP